MFVEITLPISDRRLFLILLNLVGPFVYFVHLSFIFLPVFGRLGWRSGEMRNAGVFGSKERAMRHSSRAASSGGAWRRWLLCDIRNKSGVTNCQLSLCF